ncbi:hypothetical protein PHYSODRAFT_451904, partial [Phytophthora sojae]
KWLDADAVVKVFIQDASHTPFEDEVRVWQQLRHPNVLKIYGACNAGPHLLFFVCEYASQGSLLEHVKSSAEEKPTMWKYLYEAALGLEYLHERGIVHGDLRCSSILIGSDGMAKLSNFGLSGLIKRPSAASGNVVGFMRWQAQEVMEGVPPSFESDVYSLGMCILEAVTKEMPWGSKSTDLPALACCHAMHGTLPTRPKCSGSQWKLVEGMCKLDPKQRLKISTVVDEL